MSDHTSPTIEIQLTQGKVAVVDAEDANLAAFKWCASFCPCYTGGGKYVATRQSPRENGRYRAERLHRVILSRMLGRELSRHEQVDHINGDPLDNRRANLRLATAAENQRNQGIGVNNTSGFKGAAWHKRAGRWQALIRVGGKLRYLGLFDTAEEAAHAYDAAARELHGEFARLNF